MSRTCITASKLLRHQPTVSRLQLRTMVSVPLFGMKERQPTADEKALIDDVLQLCMLYCSLTTPLDLKLTGV